ncbi:MAG TPA: hypothetical protein PKX31_00075 [Chitinophagaceae bacterium]|nr:hypothetical protein [Chitinophagaceae bacterium]
MNDKLKEIFETVCVSVTDADLRKIKFVREVAKSSAGTLLDCRKYLGYTDEDEKKDLVASQKFRNDVLHPLRNHLTKQKFSTTDARTKEIWSQEGGKSPEAIKIREVINAMLPARARKINDLQSRLASLDLV